MGKYQAYPEYKDASGNWMGKVPSHWTITSLKRVCDLSTGLTPPTSNEANYVDYDSGFSWVRPEDLNEGQAPTTASKFLSKNGWELMRVVPKSSTLICCIGTIGKAGYVQKDVSTNQQITSASFHYSPKYNYYLVKAAREVMEETATGNVIQILNSERLGGIPFLLLPKSEADKIANFLDHETAKIDTLIDKQQQLIQLLKEKRQTVISHAVTKGLNPNAPMRDSGVEWLGEVPEHWDITYIKHLSVVKRGASPRPIDDPRYFDESGDYAWVRIADVSRAGMYLTATTQRLSNLGSSLSVKLEADELFVSIAGTVGKPCITVSRACIHDGFVYFPELKINNKYLYYIFEAGEAYLGLGKMGTQLNLNTETVGGIKIGLPPSSEIENIVFFIEKSNEKYDFLINKADEFIKLMQERRTALISAAVTGKIDVRDWQVPAPMQNKEAV